MTKEKASNSRNKRILKKTLIGVLRKIWEGMKYIIHEQDFSKDYQRTRMISWKTKKLFPNWKIQQKVKNEIKEIYKVDQNKKKTRR